MWCRDPALAAHAPMTDAPVKARPAGRAAHHNSPTSACAILSCAGQDGRRQRWRGRHSST
ncbi:hypothetical protein [Komagataeibacter medellinensis]|uniref:hypothetical protein n=1 Tax=Komagataeibacter medellinensis TaxID=1177712 RepID=UPI001297F60D|nr:hypothetical protein [Komagataeibacter medellinensis]